MRLMFVHELDLSSALTLNLALPVVGGGACD
jgi:hypothetical protein